MMRLLTNHLKQQYRVTLKLEHSSGKDISLNTLHLIFVLSLLLLVILQMLGHPKPVYQD